MPGSITQGFGDRCLSFRVFEDSAIMNLLKQLNRDKEIQEMRSFIHENTGEWPKFWFWDGETIEEYRERLRKRVNEIKGIKN